MPVAKFLKARLEATISFTISTIIEFNTGEAIIANQHKTEAAFWEQKTLAEMTTVEWESLCDGCGRCCLHKLEDADDGHVYYTRVACELLDIAQCRCQDYENRGQRVPDCVKLSIDQKAYFNWLPESCAYRLLAENKPLPSWHPLITGTQDSVAAAGMNVSNIAIKETTLTDLTTEVIALKSLA